MTKQTNTPELRFPEFKNEWSKLTMNDFLMEDKQYGTQKDTNFPIVTSSRQGLYIQNKYFEGDRSFANKNVTFSIVPINYFTYRHMSDDDIFKFNINKFNTPILVSKEYPVFTVKNTFSQNFIFYELNNNIRFLKFCRIQKKGGTRTRLYFKNLLQYQTYFPNYEEQQKIGVFFYKLDQQIELEEKKLELLEQQKRGYMQKIFSQELRFKDKKDDYYSDWKNYQLKDLTYYKNGKGYEKVATTNGKYNIINLNSIGVKGQLKDSGKYTNFEDDTLLKNDLIMILSDVAKGNLIGMTAIIDENNKYLLNQRIALLRIKNSLITNAYFLYLYINFNRKYFINMSTGMSQLNINKKTVEDFQVNLPNIEEQNKIAILFKNYEDNIKKQASKVKLLKQRKKGLLQKMFV
nr:restriction endonuclease subunit S [Staphylococcus epidermidis]